MNLEEKVDLLLIDDDQAFTDQVASFTEKEGYKTVVYNDFKEAKENLFKHEANIVLIDIESGAEIMEVFKAHPEEKPETFIGFLTSNQSIADKLKSIPFEVDIYLEKPLNQETLLHYLRGLKGVKIPTPLRVLLLDDDLDFCKEVEGANRIGEIEVHCLNTIDSLFEMLLDISPHLILVDDQLDGLKGNEIVHLIRGDIRFRRTPVMLIASENDPKIVQDTVGFSLSGFISTPISLDSLHKKFREFFQKEYFLRYLEKIDPTYGIYSHKEMEHTFMTLKPLSKKIALAVFSLNREATGDEKRQFVDKLREHFSRKVPIGLFNSHHFFLLTHTYTLSRLQLLIDDFLHLEFPPNLNIEVGFAQCSEDGEDLGALIQKGLEKKKPQVCLEDSSYDLSIFTEKKLVLLISSDKELADLFSFSLLQWNVDTLLFTEGQESIQWIKKEVFKKEVEAIIIDFDLTYDNGPVLLEKLGNLVGNHIPIIAIAGKKDQHSIAEALQQGAHSFVTKPVNLQHFTRIVVQTIAQ